MKTSELYSLARIDNMYSGYYLDKGGSIWSTKRTGIPQQLKKFVKYNYYSLFVRNRSRIVYDYQIHEWMKRGDYIAWQKSQKNITDDFNTITVSADARRFIVGSIRADGSFSFAASPKVHTSEFLAKTETERLARSNPNTAYVYLEIKGTCKVGGVQWN